MSRTLHYFFYGALFLFLAIVAISFFYAWLLKSTVAVCTNDTLDQGEKGVDCGGICERACVYSEAPLLVENVWSFVERGGDTSILASVRNPNQASAATSFDYTFRLFDEQGAEFPSSHGSSFIYAGEETKYLLLGRVSLGRTVGHASVTIGSTQWVDAASFSEPDFSLEYEVTTSTTGELSVRGRVINAEAVALRDIKLIALFYGDEEDPRAAEETEIAYIAPKEAASFVVRHMPGEFTVGQLGVGAVSSMHLDPARTKVVASALRQ